MSARFQLLILLAVCACSRPSEPVRPPVILISIDTLRADHLSAWGYRGVETPNLDRFAADAITFERAFAHAPLTLPSHASIMTGLLPPEHGVRDNAGYRVDTSTPTIASVLRENGYKTGGAVSAWVLRASTGISAGFDAYDDRVDLVGGAPSGMLQRRGGETASIAETWIRTNAASPFFYFVHLFEPHTPYDPPAEIASRYASRYDGEIAATDAILGKFFDALRRDAVYDSALIIVLSDHGEGLGEHGEDEHGVLLYREALHVPLFVKLPRNARAGTHVARSVQLIDVFPTVLAAAGITHDGSTRGSSLLESAASGPIYAETMYPRIHLGWSELRSMIDYPQHLIDGPRPELYDLGTDFGERTDLVGTRRREAASLRKQLEPFRAQALATPAVSREEQARLASLGYVEAQGASARGSDLNPREHLPDLRELKAIADLMANEDYVAAEARIETLLSRNPGWSDLRDQLGVAREAMGDLEGAAAAYREAIVATPELAAEFALSLGAVLLQAGDLDGAEAHARIALTSNPPAAHDLLARIALARGDHDGALREAALIAQSASHAAAAELLTAEIHLARGDAQSAILALQRIGQTSGGNPPRLPRGYYSVFGRAFEAVGKPAEAQAAYAAERKQGARSRP
ncbi:MAG: sulfatase-like hydrolase/transferase [Thermoanaerobaculia bacterium]